MKYNEKRRLDIQTEIGSQMRDPAAALYGFLVQAERDPRFNPLVVGNIKARELFDRLAAEAGYDAGAVCPETPDGLRDLLKSVSDALWLGRRRLRALRAKLVNLPAV
ncbi:MAG: hypothetical protein HYT12_02910 [Candidatus Liptonbacteria bacterium]|nr:hypothetical protein [Candidatus Liptonbacteria bacterium]